MSHTYQAAIGDLDGDGDLDAFIVCHQFSLPSQIYLNDGSGLFTATGQDLGDARLSAADLNLLDVNGDGYVDAHVLYYSPSGLPDQVYLNDGQATFHDSGLALEEDFIAWGDINGDGDMDYFGKRWGQGYVAMLNDGTGQFTENWQNCLRSTVHGQGQLHRPAGSDFFLFPRSCYEDVPGFSIGRAGWDNWMVYKARREGWAVIDCTLSMMIVHQNHDSSLLPDGKPHYEHPETNENIRLAGGQANIRYTILDATHQLADGKLLRPKMTSARFTRKLELFLRAVFFFLPENMLENIARPKRWKKRIQKLLK